MAHSISTIVIYDYIIIIFLALNGGFGYYLYKLLNRKKDEKKDDKKENKVSIIGYLFHESFLFIKLFLNKFFLMI